MLQKVQHRAPSNRLNQLLRDHGIRVAEVARVCGVDRVTVWRWSRGTIPRRQVVKVAEMFGVTVPYLDGWPERLNEDSAELEGVA